MQARPPQSRSATSSIFARLRPAENNRRRAWRVPFLAGRRRSRTGYTFSFTPEGIAMLAVVFLVGFAAWHSGTNLLYLIFSTLIAFYLLNGFILWNNLRSITAGRDVPLMVQAGAPFHIKVQVANSKAFFPSHGLVVSSIGDGFSSQGPLFFDRVPSGETVSLEASGKFSRRGMHHLGTLAIVSRYPFGFEQRGLLLPLYNELLVIPPTYNVRAVVSEMPSGFGDQESPNKGAGTDLYGLREYVPGEHARHVHWKSSVKAQKLMIAEYHRDERRQLLVVLDNAIPADASAGGLADPFELAVILAASITKHFIDEGYEVALSTASGTVRHGNGRAHLETILRAMAIVQLTTEILEPIAVDPKVPAIELTYGRSSQPHKKRAGLTASMDATQWEIANDRFRRIGTP